MVVFFLNICFILEMDLGIFCFVFIIFILLKFLIKEGNFCICVLSWKEYFIFFVFLYVLIDFCLYFVVDVFVFKNVDNICEFLLYFKIVLIIFFECLIVVCSCLIFWICMLILLVFFLWVLLSLVRKWFWILFRWVLICCL